MRNRTIWLTVTLLVLASETSLARLATPDKWRLDIDYLASELPKRHPNPFGYISRDQFLAQLNAVKAEVDGLNDAEIAIRLQQVMAQIRDAHTEVDTRVEPQTYFPLRLHVFPDGVYVTKTTAASRAACAAKLVAVDGVDVAEVYARVATTISAENDAWLSVREEAAMVRAEVLSLLGITSEADHARFTFENPAGARFDLDLKPASLSEASAIFAPYAFGPGSPLYLQDPGRYYWYRWDADRKLMYVKYNVCQADPSRPFSAFAREIFDLVDQQTVNAFVVDVRNNTGGNSEVARPLIDGLRGRPFLRGRLYAIVGRETFSSGMLNALDLRNAGAILVGEPSGGKPNAYGEVVGFALPNSQLPVYHSTRFFHMVPDDPSSLEPDLRIDLTAADFFAGRDPVLDSIVGSPAVLPLVTAPSRRRAVALVPRCPQ